MDDLLNRAPCGFLTFGEDGVIALANDTLLDMLGHAREEVVGRHVEQILTVGSRIFYQTHWFPLLNLHGSAEEIFLMLRSRSGEPVGALVNAARHQREGEVWYDCVLMRVRERQKFEDELLRARRAAEQARDESEARKRELEMANEQLESQAVELELQQEQLRQQTVELEEAGEELRVINEELVARSDEAEHLRAVAEEANQAKSSFLAVMSHELRTPLNAIAGYVEILSMGIHGPVTEAQRNALARIARSQRHLLRLINDVLNLARIEAGRVEYLIDDVPVDALLASVTPMIEPQLESKGVRFESAVDPGLVVRGDAEKIQQILLNLLSNAAKFTPGGGEVRVEALLAPEGGHILLRVRDSGIGVPASKLEAIFEPFVQVDVGASRRSEGSGLGLAISRDLAHGMGGTLTAVSELGKGSTFTLALPIAPSDEAPGITAAAPAPG